MDKDFFNETAFELDYEIFLNQVKLQILRLSNTQANKLPALRVDLGAFINKVIDSFAVKPE